MLNRFRIFFVPLIPALISLFLTLSLGSCARPKTTKLRVFGLPFLGNAPFFIAEEEGYFAEQNIEVELVRMDDLARAIPALIKGDLDVILGDLRVATLNAVALGGTIRIVAGISNLGSTQTGSMVLIGTSAFTETLDDPEQLRGRHIATSKMSIAEYYLEKVLSAVGLTPSDVVLRHDIPITVRHENLKKGAVDLMNS